MTKSSLLAVALGTLMVAGTADAAEAGPRVAPTNQQFNQPVIGDSHRHNLRPRMIMRDRFPTIRKEPRRLERNLRIDEIRLRHFRHDSPPPPPPP